MILGDSTTPTPNSTPAIGSTPLSARRKVIGLLTLAVLALGGLSYIFYQNGTLGRLGFSWAPGYQTNRPVSEKDLPTSLDLLTNPIIYQWHGSVAGTVITTTDDSFTLSGNGSTLKIYWLSDYTKIFDPNTKKKFTSAKDLTLGLKLRGSVLFTTLGGVSATSTKPTDVVGELFNVDIATK